MLNNNKIQILFIVILTTAVYVNTLSNQFVWDDNTFINWSLIRSFGNFDEFLKGALPSSHIGDYRPLKGIILALNYQFFGTNPLGYHVQAILIHLVTTLLVYLVTRTLIEQRESGITKHNFPSSVAFLTALLFGVHPVHTEAVTFITSSSDIVGIAFFFASFYFYIKAANQHRDRKKMMAASLVLAFLAFISYEVTLVLPFILVLYELCIARGEKGTFIKKMSWFFNYLGVIIAYSILRYGILKVYEGNSWAGESFRLEMIAMAKVFAKYIELTIFPLNLSINHKISEGVLALTYVDYNPAAFAAQKLLDIKVIGGIGVVGILVILAILLYLKLPIVTFCILWFFITMAPFANLVPLNNLMTERYLYLASYSWCLVVSYFVVKAWELRNVDMYRRFLLMEFAISGFVVLLVFYSVRTVVRNMDWRDAYTFWSEALEKTDGKSVLALNNLANTYRDRGKLDDSIDLYLKAEKLNTRRVWNIPMNLGNAYMAKGNFNAAESELKLSLEYDRNNYAIYFYLGSLYIKKNQDSEAIEAFEKSVSLNPLFFDNYINLGSIYAKKGDFDKAITFFKRAKSVDKTFIVSYVNLASAYERKGEFERAMNEILEALKIEPGNEDLEKTLLRLSQKLKQNEDD